MRTPVKVAMVGLGRGGSRLAAMFESLGHAELRWLCDHNPEAQRRMRARYPNARATSDFDDLLNDESLDGVVVTTPAASHYELARRALQADKHVLVRRPLALQGDHADDLVRHAERRDRRLVVANGQLFHPGLRRLKKLLGQRRLGDVFYLYCHHNDVANGDPLESVLWTLGPYDVSIALHLLEDEPVEIAADGASYLEPGISDVANCQLRFATGIRAHIFLSRLDPRLASTVTVVGSRKTAVFNAARADRNLTMFDGQGDIVTPHLPHEEPLRLECEHFLTAVRSSGHAGLTGREGAAVVNVLEQMQQTLENAWPVPSVTRRRGDSSIVKLVAPVSNGESV